MPLLHYGQLLMLVTVTSEVMSCIILQHHTYCVIYLPKVLGVANSGLLYISRPFAIYSCVWFTCLPFVVIPRGLEQDSMLQFWCASLKSWDTRRNRKKIWTIIFWCPPKWCALRKTLTVKHTVGNHTNNRSIRAWCIQIHHTKLLACDIQWLCTNMQHGVTYF